ncbi:hypothetical protein GX48_01745 [Paracoccidioides brasiliensis]|nr:hypothetical protein GX48_01745 [Paracoccidioides brasiliensis]
MMTQRRVGRRRNKKEVRDNLNSAVLNMFASTETQFDNRVLAKSPHSDSAAKEQPPSTSRYSGQVSITGSVDLNLDRDRNCFPQGSVLGMSQAVNQSTESPGNPVGGNTLPSSAASQDLLTG